MERRYGWSAIQFGPWLGVINVITAAALLLKGGLIDWLYGRGMKDAHVRFYNWLCIASLPGVLMLFSLNDPRAFLALYGALQIPTLTYMVFLAPAIQIFTPVHLRGQVMAAFMMVSSLMTSLGPVIVGLLTDYILRDEQKVGTSLAIVVSAAVLISIVLLRLSLRGMRDLMTLADAPARSPSP